MSLFPYILHAERMRFIYLVEMEMRRIAFADWFANDTDTDEEEIRRKRSNRQRKPDNTETHEEERTPVIHKKRNRKLKPGTQDSNTERGAFLTEIEETDPKVAEDNSASGKKPRRKRCKAKSKTQSPQTELLAIEYKEDNSNNNKPEDNCDIENKTEEICQSIAKNNNNENDENNETMNNTTIEIQRNQGAIKKVIQKTEKPKKKKKSKTDNDTNDSCKTVGFINTEESNDNTNFDDSPREGNKAQKYDLLSSNNTNNAHEVITNNDFVSREMEPVEKVSEIAEKSGPSRGKRPLSEASFAFLFNRPTDHETNKNKLKTTCTENTNNIKMNFDIEDETQKNSCNSSTANISATENANSNDVVNIEKESVEKESDEKETNEKESDEKNTSDIDKMSKYEIPEHVLDKLKCGLCYEYLSYPPITNYAETGSVCGRCPVLEAEKNIQPLREESYERVARGMLIFPCRYRPQGCVESFSMDNIPDHEQSCTFKPFFCPILPLGNCPWQGSIEELHAHFAGVHHDLLLEEPYFEADVLNNHKVHFLIPELNELFLLRVEFNNYDSTFRCAVHYIGSPESAKKYQYEIIFNNDNLNIFYPLPKKQVDTYLNFLMRENENSVDVLNLRNILKNPSIIRCRINVIEELNNTEYCEAKSLSCYNEYEEENDDLEEITTRMENITMKLLLDIECPVCQEFMIPPIFQCVTGHSVCGECKRQLRECPSCRAAMGNTRNFTLEKITENISYSCKNRIDGCKFLTSAANIRKHESECKFSPHHCPLTELLECEWTGRISKVMAHVKSKHPEYIQKDCFCNICYNASSVSSEVQRVMEIHGEVFRLRYAYNNEKKSFSVAVQYLGPSLDACKFMYEIYLIDLTGNNFQLMSKKYCGAIKDSKDDFKHCTMWYLDMALPFLSKDNLFKMKCKILKL